MHLKRITEFYSLTPRETILLELFNLMDETEQIDRLCNLAGYLGGRGILSLEESKKLLCKNQARKRLTVFSTVSLVGVKIQNEFIYPLEGLFAVYLSD